MLLVAGAFLLAGTVLVPAVSAEQPFFDRTYPSKVFGQARHYRIILPPDYETSGKRYPVIYYFHGHSDRYTLEKYDDGKDTIPKMVRFVAGHDLIVVTVDGYVAEHYTGFYGGSPWDIRRDGGDYDFGEVFREMVCYIDGHYRTLTDRRHRAVSGLSMGGFMSLYLSARYPALIGSASAFNPGPEFFVGDKGRRSLWRPKDHVLNHSHTMVRLIRASGDFISQYHEETRDAYARAHEVDFEYRRDEYHRHWATSIGETFSFHMRAFANPALDNVPDVFSHDDAWRRFDVWGYHVELKTDDPAIVYLKDVRQGGLRVTTRQWAPDGPPLGKAPLKVVTAPVYKAGAVYKLIDFNLETGETTRGEVTADSDGHLTIRTDAAGHQISFAGPGTGSQPPVLLPVTSSDRLRLRPNREISLPVRVYNPREAPMKGITVKLESNYPTVAVLSGSARIPEISSGGFADVSGDLRLRLTAAQGGYFAPARLHLKIGYDGWHSITKQVDILIIPEAVPAPVAYEILDGRTRTFPVFRQKGNQGGGSSITREVTEGTGNGNGILEPGEEATIWVKLRQGLDPFDKGNWSRAKVYSESPWVKEVGDIQELKQLEWTGAQNRTSLIRFSPDAPAGEPVSLLLDNESWSYYYTPDVRYGTEPLYQAFQLHSHQLHELNLKARRPGK